jgi:hypothetical protein
MLSFVNDHEIKKSKKRRRAEDQWRLLLLLGCLPYSLFRCFFSLNSVV